MKLQVVVIDVVMALVSAVVVGQLAVWLSTPSLWWLLPYGLAQLGLAWSAWRLRKMGADRRASLRNIALKMAVAMSALVVPLLTVAVLLAVSGLDAGKASPLHRSMLEPVAMLGCLAISAIYPLLLLWHVLSPAKSRWEDEGAARRATRDATLAVDLQLVLLSAYVVVYGDGWSVSGDLVVNLVVVATLYGLVALPRFALVASRFDRVVFLSAVLFVASRVIGAVR